MVHSGARAFAPSSRYSGERVGERGERRVETESAEFQNGWRSYCLLSPRATNPSPPPFHPPLRGDLRSTGRGSKALSCLRRADVPRVSISPRALRVCVSKGETIVAGALKNEAFCAH